VTDRVARALIATLAHRVAALEAAQDALYTAQRLAEATIAALDARERALDRLEKRLDALAEHPGAPARRTVLQ
jgi:hypothetical protein